MIAQIKRATVTNPDVAPLYMVVNSGIYNSAPVRLSETYIGSANDTKNFIRNWCASNLDDTLGDVLMFPWPVKSGQNPTKEEAYKKVLRFFDSSPTAESGSTIQSTIYANVLYPSYSTIDYSGSVSRIAAANAGLLPGYIQSWLTATGSFQGYFPVFPESVVKNNHWDFTDLTTSDYIGLMFVSIAQDTGGNYRLSSYDLNYQHITLTSAVLTNLQRWNNVGLTRYDPDDPYTSAGYPASTAPGGASGGSFNFTEDGITGVHTPSLDLLNTGLITAWRPSKATLAQLANWLWTTTPGQIIQQLFGNPINAIIGLNIVPVSPTVDGGTNTIKFGVEDSGVACPKITNQHVTLDCGSLKISPKYGSYMDYAPQASAELFLPYVGGLPLDMNDVMDKTINVKYQVDVLSGACVAYVFIDGVLHYQKAGGCAATAPITGSQMPNVVSGVLSIVGSVAGAIASMGASGAGTAAKVASGIATGTSVAESAANMMKQSISYAGTISGWAGLLGAQKPYLILSLPHAAIPGGQNVLMGYPAWVSGRVGDFTGYTECTVDKVTATRATDQEIDEIKNLLAGGVVL